MNDRKQTPDILADLLNGEGTTGVAPAAAATVARAASKPATSPAAAKPRQKTTPRPAEAKSDAFAPALWEHRVASFQEHHGWRLRFVDGVSARGWVTGPLLHEYIAELQTEGWQVAAACSGQAMFGVTDKYQVFFKRQASG